MCRAESLPTLHTHHSQRPQEGQDPTSGQEWTSRTVYGCHGNSTFGEMYAEPATPQTHLHCVVREVKVCVCGVMWKYLVYVMMVYSSSSSSDDNKCCWLERLLCHSSIILLHKRTLGHYRAVASYWCTEMLWQCRISSIHASKAFGN